MGLLVVLVPADLKGLTLGTSALDAFARLGVTSVSLARDENTAAVILEGWGFDAGRADAVLAALGATPGEARTLQPVAQLAVMAASTEGGVLE